MEVVLTPELEDLITRQVDQGNYPSPGEVVRDALRLLKEQLENREKRLAALKRDVTEGIEALDRGDFEEYGSEELSELLGNIKARGRDRLRQAG